MTTIRYIATCIAAALTIGSAAQKIVIEPIDILDDANVINPYVADSVLYFASDAKNSVTTTYVDQNDKRLYQLFRIDLKNKRPDGTPRSYFRDNNRSVNQVGIVLNNGRAYVTQNNENENSRKGNVLGIYEHHIPVFEQPQGNGQLVLRQPKNSSVAYPSISADGRLMVFASDMAGGQGSSDLYICERQSDGKWGEPMNMGPRVNTAKAETSPFIHPSGKIFFASNGREDSRKLDIYYTYRTDEGFAQPVRFDVAINSMGDDYGFYYSANEEWGYLTSNRHGQERLYFFHQLFPVFDEESEMVEENYCFTFYEGSTENYDADMFDFKWKFSDGTELKGVEVDHCFEGEGQYLVQLTVLDKTSQEELFDIAEYPLWLSRPEQVNIVFPEKINAGARVEFTANGNNITSFTPTTYYWDFGHGIRVKGQNATMTFPTKGTYRVRCGTIADEDPTVMLCTWVDVVVE